MARAIDQGVTSSIRAILQVLVTVLSFQAIGLATCSNTLLKCGMLLFFVSGKIFLTMCN